MQVGQEAFIYVITLSDQSTTGRNLINSSEELMVYGQRQDETSVRWHYFPRENVVTYSVGE
jgi:hypothetical protein